MGKKDHHYKTFRPKSKNYAVVNIINMLTYNANQTEINSNGGSGGSSSSNGTIGTDNIQLLFTINNPSNINITNITLILTPPSNITNVVYSIPNPNTYGATFLNGVVNISNLPARTNSGTFGVTYDVNTNGTYNWNGIITSSTPNVSFNSSITINDIVPQGILSYNIAQLKSSYGSYDVIDQIFSIQNTSTVTVNNIILTLNPPPGISNVTYDVPNPNTYGATFSNGVLTIPSLPAGINSGQINVIYDVTSNGTYDWNGTITSNNAPIVPFNSSITINDISSVQGSLIFYNISQSSSHTSSIDYVALQFNIKNTSTTAVNNISFTLNIPFNVNNIVYNIDSFNSYNATFANGILTIPSLPAGVIDGLFSVNYNVTSNGTYDWTGVMTSSNSPSVPFNSSITITDL